MNTTHKLNAVNVPVCYRCCRCQSPKMVVAWELTGAKSNAVNPCRYYCLDCAKVKGFTPSDMLKGRTLDEVGGLPKKCDRPKRKYTKKRSA
jgi:hypothetical protein